MVITLTNFYLIFRKPRGRPPTAQMVANVDFSDMDSSSAMSSSEQVEHRYQRMRQLNNAASKRSRINHDRKFKTQKDNLILLTAKNMELKGKVADLETQVAKFKTDISNLMKKRTTKHVQSCPEGASTTSNPQNDLSILSFNLLPKSPDDQLPKEIYINDKATIENQIESSTEKEKSLFVTVSHSNLLAKATTNNFAIESYKNKDFFCEQCKLQFDKKIVYDIHLKIVHNKDTTIKSELVDDKNDIPIEPSCDDYNENFSLCKKPVNDNSTVHEGKMQFKCIFCNASFSNHFSLKNHREEFHEGKEVLVHKCLSTEDTVNSSNSIQNVIMETLSNFVETFPGLPAEPLPRLPREPLARLPTEPLPKVPSEPLPRSSSQPPTMLPTEPLPRLPMESLARLTSEPLPRPSSQPLTILPREPLSRLSTEPLPRLPIEPLPRLLSEPLPRIPTKPLPRLPSEPLTRLPTEPLTRLPIEPIPIGIQNVNGGIIETFPRLPKEAIPIQTFQEMSTEPIPYQKLDNFESPSIFETTESTLAQKSIMHMLPKSPVSQLHEEIHIKDEQSILL